ncbi:hypothetical protein GQ53DRAFT_758693 [Thozetella sp. PMI_491]|nr:hypothetical protein GQ53DRAFT_758693 [Thozetella sp. PMI_491]
MDAQTIIEMNKARVKMGMRPLPVPGEDDAAEATRASDNEEDEDTPENRDAVAQENWKKMEEERAAKKRREEKAAAIKKAREMAQRNVVLEGKALGDISDGEDQSAKSWIKNTNKRQKDIQKKRKQQEAAEAAAAASADYSGNELTGVTIGHDQASFLDGEDHILTLKDTGVLDDDEEGDELEAFALRESEKLTDRLDLKKKKPGYNPNDVDETGEYSILAQYDEEISGKKRKTFKLGTTASTKDDLADILSAPVQARKFQTVDLGDLHDAPAPTSDYIDASEIKIKSKKKKSKATRKRAADDEDGLYPAGAVADNSMDVDLEPVVYTKKKKIVDDDFVDDDDLQATLAQQRRDALKKRKRVRPEDIAKQLREQASQSPEPEDGVGDADKGLVFDEISRFVDAIHKPTEDEEAKRRLKAKPEKTVTAMQEESSEDEDMQDVAEVKDEPVETEEEVAGLGEEEKIVGGGMAEALQLLKERGLVSQQEGASHNSYRQKQQFLVELRRRMAEYDEDTRAQRERDRASGRLDRMSTKEREDWQRNQNAQRDLHQARILDQLYRQGYKPNVDLKYIDEHGRQLDQKEAFKELSHGFHGKKSGKGKTEKLLKKIEDEKRRNAQSVLDASQNVGMSSAATLQGRKRREAGIRLA